MFLKSLKHILFKKIFFPGDKVMIIESGEKGRIKKILSKKENLLIIVKINGINERFLSKELVKIK